MPINFISPEQSFVQLNAEEVICNNYPELCLPVANKFDIGFQFTVDGNVAKTQGLKGAVASNNCQVIAGLIFGTEIITGICDKRVLDIPAGEFYLQRIILNGVSITYGRDVNADELMELLETDFEITTVGTNAILECCANVLIIEITNPGDFNYDFNNDFDIGGGAFINSYTAWHTAYFDITDVPITVLNIGDCFRYAILDATNDEVLACSNCFKIVDDVCYTTFITYQNNEDAFGFLYGEGIYNKIRLPFYLRAPTNPTSRKIYRKSNAQYKTLSAVYDREYSLLTDWLPDWFHEKLAIAAGHDYVKMDNSLFQVNSEVSVEGYAPDWPDDDITLLAMGKARVKHAKYSYKNNSCGVNGCTDYVLPPEPPCVEPSIIGIDLINGSVNQPYNTGYTITGSLPFSLSNVVAPAWLNIFLIESNIQLAGTPTPADAGSDIPVSFTLTNACGSADFADTINVVAQPGSSGLGRSDYTIVSEDTCLSVIRVAVYAPAGNIISINAPVVVSGFLHLPPELVFFGDGILPGTNAYLRPILITVTLDNGGGNNSVVTIYVTDDTAGTSMSLAFTRNNTNPPC